MGVAAGLIVLLIAVVQGTAYYTLETVAAGLKVSDPVAYQFIRKREWLGLSVALGASLFGMALGLYLTRSFRSTVEKTSRIAEKIAQGDLRVERIEIPAQDERGQMARAVNKIADEFKVFVNSNYLTISELTSVSVEMGDPIFCPAGLAMRLSLA